MKVFRVRVINPGSAWINVAVSSGVPEGRRGRCQPRAQRRRSVRARATRGLPVAQLVRLCYAGRHIEPEMLARISGRGGPVADLGTSDPREGDDRIDSAVPWALEGEEEVRRVVGD
jgi:butyrate kinase